LNPLEEFFNLHFNPNQVYSNQEIRDIFQNADIPIPNSGNPTAFTYNRWNKGMDLIFPVFIHEKRRYKYVGRNFNYTGPVYHHANGNRPEIIANFENGNYAFIQPGVNTLREWKNCQKEQG
jgi:hypothetical protein